MTAFHMYQEADKQDGPNADIAHLFDPFNLKQGYIIALGVNDLKGKNNLNAHACCPEENPADQRRSWRSSYLRSFA